MSRCGMVATALLGGVFAAQGEALFRAFHIAVIACAIASLLAGVFAFALIGTRARLRRGSTSSP